MRACVRASPSTHPPTSGCVHLGDQPRVVCQGVGERDGDGAWEALSARQRERVCGCEREGRSSACVRGRTRAARLLALSTAHSTLSYPTLPPGCWVGGGVGGSARLLARACVRTGTHARARPRIHTCTHTRACTRLLPHPRTVQAVRAVVGSQRIGAPPQLEPRAGDTVCHPPHQGAHVGGGAVLLE